MNGISEGQTFQLDQHEWHTYQNFNGDIYNYAKTALLCEHAHDLFCLQSKWVYYLTEIRISVYLYTRLLYFLVDSILNFSCAGRLDIVKNWNIITTSANCISVMIKKLQIPAKLYNKLYWRLFLSLVFSMRKRKHRDASLYPF